MSGLWRAIGRRLAVRRSRFSAAQAKRRFDAQWREKEHFETVLRAASDAALAAAPPDLPPVRDRNLGIGVGLEHGGACYVFATDTGYELAKAKKLTEWLDQATRKEMLARGYPPGRIEEFRIWFTTHDEIVRKTGGNYYYYFN